MTISLTPRQITVTERDLMRLHGQWSELFVAIDDPATVFTCLLDTDNLPASNDGVAEITIASGEFSGDYGFAFAGMTIRVGSAAGLDDLGVVRLRAHYEGGTTIKIGETSDVEWIVTPQAARYLTIVDEFRVWPRLLKIEGPTDSADLTGLASCVTGESVVYGGYDDQTSCEAVNDYQAQAGTATIYLKVGGTLFTEYFETGMWCFVANGYGGIGGQLGYVVYVDDYTLSFNLTMFYPGPDPTMLVYPVLTEFLTELVVGDSITLDGGGTAEITAVTNNAHATVGAAWTSSVANAAYHTTNLTIYMDYDVPVVDEDDYNQQYEYPSPPVPILGSPIVLDRVHGVAIEDGNPIEVQLDASGSYQIDGTIASYDWLATDGTFDDATLPDPVLTIDQAGTYRVTCGVTPTDGNMAIGHRKIYAFDKDNPPFTLARLENLEGSVDGGGWSARLTVYGDADAIRDQAEVILFARDHYGATRQEIAQDTQRANIVMVGYVVGETINVDPELNTVTFDVAGPQFWLDRVMGVATAVEDADAAPTIWTSMYTLTIDRALWHLFVWRSTWCLGHDLYLTGDTRRIAFLEGKLGSLISQVDQMAKQVVLARAACDRLGRMVVELEPQLIPSTERATPFVQPLDPQDVRAPISFQRRTVNEVARMTASGTAWDGATATPCVSTVPGSVFRTHGRIDSVQSLALEDQAQCDLLARLLLANRNNPYPSIPLPLAGINRLLDVAPAMYVVADLSDNPRGLALDNLPVLIKKISCSHDPETGEFLVDVEGEGWTDETTRIEGAPPSEAFEWPT